MDEVRVPYGHRAIGNTADGKIILEADSMCPLCSTRKLRCLLNDEDYWCPHCKRYFGKHLVLISPKPSKGYVR